MNTLSHDDLASDLAAHLRGGSNRITWENMQLGESGSARPDVYTMEPTYTRLSFEAFEVKVSTADFRRDVTSGKWQAYLEYANSVTFAAPRGLISKDDVPATCGLILRGEGGAWRYAKKPVSHALREIPWKAWIKLLIDGTKMSTFDRTHRHFNAYLANQKLGKKFGQEAAKMLADLESLPAALEYRRQNYDAEIARMNDELAAARERAAQGREQILERCSGALSRLAAALGLPHDAMVVELQAKAEAVADALIGGRHSWKLAPFDRVARDLEAALVSVREMQAIVAQHREPVAT